MPKPKIAWVKFFRDEIMICYRYGKGYKRKIKKIEGQNKTFYLWCAEHSKTSIVYQQCFVPWIEFTF